jgi:diguanylate cyclase (GGDEF)-like protein
MNKSTYGSPTLLPQVETIFIYARGITAIGLVFWLFFSLPEDPGRVPVQILLGLFAAHLGLFFMATTHRWTSRTNIYWVTLLFDVFFVTLVVRYTGGVESEFFLLYFLAIGFGSYYLGKNAGLLLSFIITLNYLLTNSQAIPHALFGDILMKLAFLWFFAGAIGYISEYLRQSEEKLLRTLNTLNERTSELEKAHAELETVYETARSLGEHNDPEKIINELLTISLKMLGYQHLGVLMYNQQRSGLLLVARTQLGQMQMLRPPVLYDLAGIAGYVARSGRSQRLYDISTDDRYQSGLDGARSELAVPMISRGRTLGVLNAESVELGAFAEKDEKILSILASSAAMALENARLHKQLEDQSTTDELTGVHNFRHFSERLKEEQRRARRYGQPLSLIMVDIDWFKHCNDTYGHQAGNLVLKGIARVIRGIVRDTDVVCRYGGEEFIVILPQTMAADAHEIGERIRAEVERAEFSDDGLMPSLRVTVSIGVSTYPDNGGTTDNLVEMVDRALYRAKGSGKNIVCAA